MFERFTGEAREVVVAAQEEATRRGDGWIGTEHLLVGLVGSPGLAPVFRVHGLTLDDVRERIAGHVPPDDDLDADALATLGIDLDAVRRAAEQRFGEGALARRGARRGRGRLTPRAKKVLELSLLEAIRRHDRSIGSGHLLLGLLRERGGLAARVMVEAGVDLDDLRREVDDRLDGRHAA